jgi:hypothetical protein
VIISISRDFDVVSNILGMTSELQLVLLVISRLHFSPIRPAYLATLQVNPSFKEVRPLEENLLCLIRGAHPDISNTSANISETVVAVY